MNGQITPQKTVRTGHISSVYELYRPRQTEAL